MSQLTETGMKVFGELMGEHAAGQLGASFDQPGFGTTIGKLATDFVFGTIWARDGLERKQRSLVVIGVLIALKQTAELKNHIRIGITNGLTVREIEEALIQTIPYVGFPAVTGATAAIIEVLRERGLDTHALTGEERGLL